MYLASGGATLWLKAGWLQNCLRKFRSEKKSWDAPPPWKPFFPYFNMKSSWYSLYLSFHGPFNSSLISWITFFGRLSNVLLIRRRLMAPIKSWRVFIAWGLPLETGFAMAYFQNVSLSHGLNSKNLIKLCKSSRLFWSGVPVKHSFLWATNEVIAWLLIALGSLI